jgi:uncharacterized protein (TIGR02246 family)
MDEGERETSRRGATQWAEAWNRHDMSMMAELLTEEADFVNVLGNHGTGRADIAHEHATWHQRQFTESVWTTRSVHVQALQPDLALVHVAWAIRGDRAPDGTTRQPRQGIFTWVMPRHRETWDLRAAHNTDTMHVPIISTRS